MKSNWFTSYGKWARLYFSSTVMKDEDRPSGRCSSTSYVEHKIQNSMIWDPGVIMQPIDSIDPPVKKMHCIDVFHLWDKIKASKGSKVGLRSQDNTQISMCDGKSATNYMKSSRATEGDKGGRNEKSANLIEGNGRIKSLQINFTSESVQFVKEFEDPLKFELVKNVLLQNIASEAYRLLKAQSFDPGRLSPLADLSTAKSTDSYYNINAGIPALWKSGRNVSATAVMQKHWKIRCSIHTDKKIFFSLVNLSCFKKLVC